MSVGIKSKNKKEIILQAVFLAILLLYPLRHITWGLDLGDTGYNYANFQYMGTEHMDPMWLFSTYLATSVGHFLTKLPFADGLVGMNFYTGLFASALAIVGYLFCTKKLGIKPWIAFLGEMLALSLCWCPTALIYNYLTYLLVLFCMIFLYKGLYEKKKWFLFAAGVCLGTNLFVRFSNLPEAALIVAVWAYAVIEGLESKRTGKKYLADIFKQAFSHTMWCLRGYFAALLVFGGYIHLRYGLNNYAAGIRRLFGMTENATDYKATNMLKKLFQTYLDYFYWVNRIVVIVVAGLVFFAIVKLFAQKVSFIRRSTVLTRILLVGSKAVWVLVCAAMLVWMDARGICTRDFRTYNAMLGPGILFLMLTMFIALIRIFHKNSPKQEKLISGMVLLVVLLSSIGSNNGLFTTLNNLFVAAPYTFWQSYLFLKKAKEYRPGVKGLRWLTISAFPAKGVLAAFLALFIFQISLFGACFAFMEGAGVRDISAKVENNEILRGVRMSPERAKWMTEASAYVEEAGLQGREVILYGFLPALSYYFQMPSAFNPWSDLASYNVNVMREELAGVKEQAVATGERPVVILTNSYVGYDAGGSPILLEDESDEKWLALKEYMEELPYEKTFSNEKFTIWE